MKVTESKFHTKVNIDQSNSYYDYTNFIISPGNIEQYKVTARMGRGKYSEVFEGKTDNHERIVIKVLKPVKQSKINREVMILQHLDHKNILSLRDTVYDKATDTYSLIFNYIKHVDTCIVFDKLNLTNVKFYCKQILEALDYAHSRGVVHRDIKPQNIIVNAHTKQLQLIDWGLAEFYIPGDEYSVRVASKFYKSPELLVGYPFYDYSLDIWSFGCMLAEFLFKKRPFFYGQKNNDQLVEISKILGTADLYTYVSKYEIPYVFNPLLHTIRKDRQDFLSLVEPGEFHLIEDGIDLLEKILVYDHQLRPSAEECLQHKFFN